MAHSAVEGLERAREESRWIGQEVLEGAYGTEFLCGCYFDCNLSSRGSRGQHCSSLFTKLYFAV